MPHAALAERTDLQQLTLVTLRIAWATTLLGMLEQQHVCRVMPAGFDQRGQHALGFEVACFGADESQSSQDAEHAIVYRQHRVAESEQQRERRGLRADAEEAHQISERI